MSYNKILNFNFTVFVDGLPQYLQKLDDDQLRNFVTLNAVKRKTDFTANKFGTSRLRCAAPEKIFEVGAISKGKNSRSRLATMAQLVQ